MMKRLIFALLFALAVVNPALAQSPFVILFSAQSNGVITPPLSWTPAPNAKRWNFDGIDTHVGTAYAALSSTTINVSDKLASDIGYAFPWRQVCLINVSFSMMSISHWLTGTGAPDIYQNILNQISPALSACGGATKVDLFGIWDGETDNANGYTGWPADFETLMTRLKGNTAWFPADTPVLLHSIASTAINGNANSDTFNSGIFSAANADPANRRFIYTPAFPQSIYWDQVTIGHMSGLGFFYVGEMGARAVLEWPGRPSVIAPDGEVESGWIGYTPTITSYGGAFSAYSLKSRFKKSGKRVTVEWDITSMTGGGGGIFVSLPFPADANNYTGEARDYGFNGAGGTVSISAGGTTALLITSASASFIASGAKVISRVRYDIP